MPMRAKKSGSCLSAGPLRLFFSGKGRVTGVRTQYWWPPQECTCMYYVSVPASHTAPIHTGAHEREGDETQHKKKPPRHAFAPPHNTRPQGDTNLQYGCGGNAYVPSCEKEDGKGGRAGSRAGVWVGAGREKARCSGTCHFFRMPRDCHFSRAFFFPVSGAYQSCAPTPPWRVEEANLLFDAQQANKDLPLNVVARSAPVATSVIYSSSFSNIFTRRRPTCRGGPDRSQDGDTYPADGAKTQGLANSLAQQQGLLLAVVCGITPF